MSLVQQKVRNPARSVPSTYLKQVRWSSKHQIFCQKAIMTQFCERKILWKQNLRIFNPTIFQQPQGWSISWICYDLAPPARMPSWKVKLHYRDPLCNVILVARWGVNPIKKKVSWVHNPQITGGSYFNPTLYLGRKNPTNPGFFSSLLTAGNLVLITGWASNARLINRNRLHAEGTWISLGRQLDVIVFVVFRPTPEIHPMLLMDENGDVQPFPK